MMKRNCLLKIIMCDAGASGLHSHAGAWERGKLDLNCVTPKRNKKSATGFQLLCV